MPQSALKGKIQHYDAENDHEILFADETGSILTAFSVLEVMAIPALNMLGEESKWGPESWSPPLDE